MSNRLRALCIAYLFPHASGPQRRDVIVGGERMRQFAARLPAHGIDTHVITHHAGATTEVGPGLTAARDLFRTAVSGTWADMGRSQKREVDSSGLRRQIPRLTFPDRPTYTWAPLAVRTALQLARRERFDLVLSTSPPMAAHVAAFALAKLWGVPWIADVRDGYSFEPPEGSVPLMPLRRAFERTLYQHAARVITVTDELRDDLRRLLPERSESVITITNGYDETLFEACSGGDEAGDAWEILYTGSTSSRSGFSLDRVLDGVDRFAQRIDQSVRLTLIGMFSPSEYARPLKRAQLEVMGWLPRAAVARSMQRADTSLVLTGNHSSVATTKLFEYIGAGRPILVVGPDSAAARLLLDGEFGVVSEDDPDRIADALERVYRDRTEWDARLVGAPMRRAREAFSRGVQAARIARIMREVVERGDGATTDSRARSDPRAQ